VFSIIFLTSMAGQAMKQEQEKRQFWTMILTGS
jgi:hypothetical protein